MNLQRWPAMRRASLTSSLPRSIGASTRVDGAGLIPGARARKGFAWRAVSPIQLEVSTREAANGTYRYHPDDLRLGAGL